MTVGLIRDGRISGRSRRYALPFFRQDADGSFDRARLCPGSFAWRCGPGTRAPLFRSIWRQPGGDFVPRGEANKGLELEFATEGFRFRPPLKAPLPGCGPALLRRACVHISMVVNPLEIQIFNLLTDFSPLYRVNFGLALRSFPFSMASVSGQQKLFFFKKEGDVLPGYVSGCPDDPHAVAG